MEYVCKELIGEYKAVVQRPKLKKYIGEKDVLDTLELMSLYCFCVDIEKPAVSPIRDVKDLYLLSLADTIPADYIISGDKDLLVLGKHNETRILDSFFIIGFVIIPKKYPPSRSFETSY